MIRPKKTLEDSLLKEAMQRIAPSGRVYDFKMTKAERNITCNLLKESEARLLKTRFASLEKEGMAAQSGVKDIRNSTANTVFGNPVTSENPDSIEGKLYSAFSKWFYSTVGAGQGASAQHLPVNAGVFIPDTPGSTNFKKVPNSQLRIEFPFYRPILPTQQEFADNSTSAIQALEQIIPNIGRFIAELESNNIPVNPFFHSTVRKRSLGGVNSKEAIDFIMPQVGKPVQMPNGEMLPTSGSFYQDHATRLNSDRKVQLTVQQNHNRKYDHEHAWDLNVPTSLLKAIESKITQGYGVNWKDLKAHLREEMNKLIKANDYQHSHLKTQQLSDDQRLEISRKKQAYVDHYTKIYQSIKSAFEKAVTPIGRGEDANEWYGIGGPFTEFKLRGFRVSGKGGQHITTTDVASMHLKIALYYMTKKITPGESFLGPGEFTIPNNKMTYYSNGFDSVPTDANDNMSVFPSLRRDDRGEVGYDTDQCNLGRVHLVHNGRSIETMMQRWGRWCDGAIKVLMGNQNIGDNVATDVWKTIMFNRTNAETVIDIVQRYPDYESFRQGFLNESLASGYTGSRGLEETGTMQESVISANGFELLKQFGYQFSKMMDVVSGIAHRSCEEIITSRSDSGETIEERFYGRTLSTATGKSENSTIIIGIRYADPNPTPLAQHDPELQALVDDHRRRGAIAPQKGQEWVRRTRHHQQGTPMPDEFQQPGSAYRVMHDLRFFVGLATSKSNFKKAIGPDDYDTWDKALNVLLTRYPQISNELGVIIEPMNANLKEMSSRFKNALVRVQKDMQGRQSSIEIVVEDKVEHTTEVLDAAAVAAKNDINQEQTSDSFQPQAPDQAAAFTTEQPQTPDQAAALPPDPQPQELNLLGDEKTPAALPKPMLGKDEHDTPGFVGKRDTKQRNLVRHRPNPLNGKLQHACNDSLFERLAQSAEKLDKSGEELLAAKIDFLLGKLSEELNANEKS